MGDADGAFEVLDAHATLEESDERDVDGEHDAVCFMETHGERVDGACCAEDECVEVEGKDGQGALPAEIVQAFEFFGRDGPRDVLGGAVW